MVSPTHPPHFPATLSRHTFQVEGDTRLQVDGAFDFPEPREARAARHIDDGLPGVEEAWERCGPGVGAGRVGGHLFSAGVWDGKAEGQDAWTNTWTDSGCMDKHMDRQWIAREQKGDSKG
eukprot:361347-Chlamydomonas_euryale.AAC.5